MKKTIITLAAGLLFTSISMALSAPGAASDSPVILPCGKIFTKNVARNDKKSNFYAQMIAKGSTGAHSKTKSGNTTY